MMRKMGILGSVRMHGVRGTGDAAQIGISQSQVFTTARGFAGKKKHGKKREKLFSSGKRCIYCDTKFRATGRKIICVTQRNRFSIRNTFCFRAVLLRPWSRAPSLSSRPKNPRFACRYTLAGHMGVTCLVTVEITCSQRIETQRSATVRSFFTG